MEQKELSVPDASLRILPKDTPLDFFQPGHFKIYQTAVFPGKIFRLEGPDDEKAECTKWMKENGWTTKRIIAENRLRKCWYPQEGPPPDTRTKEEKLAAEREEFDF